MPSLVEIGPSNVSQGQHRRKGATEQIKNLTLAGSRTQIPGFSSADAVTAMPRVPVAGPDYIYIYIHTYNHLPTLSEAISSDLSLLFKSPFW